MRDKILDLRAKRDALRYMVSQLDAALKETQEIGNYSIIYGDEDDIDLVIDEIDVVISQLGHVLNYMRDFTEAWKKIDSRFFKVNGDV